MHRSRARAHLFSTSILCFHNVLHAIETKYTLVLENSFNTGTSVLERRQHPGRPRLPRFDPDGDLDDVSNSTGRSFTTRSTERLRLRRQTQLHSNLFGTTRNPGDEQLSSLDRPSIRSRSGFSRASEILLTEPMISPGLDAPRSPFAGNVISHSTCCRI